MQVGGERKKGRREGCKTKLMETLVWLKTLIEFPFFFYFAAMFTVKHVKAVQSKSTKPHTQGELLYWFEKFSVQEDYAYTKIFY